MEATLRQVSAGQEFLWKDERISALVSRVREHSDGRVTAEVSFKVDKQGVTHHILQSRVNLLSTHSKRELVERLHAKHQLRPGRWDAIVEELCYITLDNYRRGKPAVEVWPAEDGEELPESPLLIRPLLYEGKPTILFGEGSAGKSYLALTLAIIAQLPYYDNPLHLTPKQANTLYLDYESDESEFKRRLTLLERGFGLPSAPILYRECNLPLLEDIERLEEIVAEHGIRFIVIDSLGVAAGNASLNDAQTATAFYSALRRLNVTSLIITHTAKDAETRRASPFGSVYFTNLARSVWEARRQQEENSAEIAVALFHRKNNQGPLLSPQGFRIAFHDQKTVLRRMEPETVPEFFERMSLKARIITLLKESGKLSAKELAEELDKPENTIRAILSKNKDNFVKVGNQWGLKCTD